MKLKRFIPHLHVWAYLWEGEVRRCVWCGRTQYKQNCYARLEQEYLRAKEYWAARRCHRKIWTYKCRAS